MHAHAQQEAHADQVSLATPRLPEPLRHGQTSKAPSRIQSSRVPERNFSKEPQPARNNFWGGAPPADVQSNNAEPRMSPAYVQADDAT